MRPINLIPEDERGAGGGAVSIRGLRVWGIGGGLALAVIGIVMLVTTSNALSEREHEVERLEHEQTVAEARAAKLDPYTAFQQTAMARRETVATLAASRFDWERVMRELALIVPDDVTVLSLTATVSSETSVSEETVAVRLSTVTSSGTISANSRITRSQSKRLAASVATVSRRAIAVC